VKEKTVQAFDQGYHVITGGATGVDTFVIEEALEQNPDADRLTILIPEPLDEAYYWDENWGELTDEARMRLDRAEEAVKRVMAINPAAVKADLGKDVEEKEKVSLRNRMLMEEADEVLGFLIRPSGGTIYTLRRARELGKKVTCLDHNGDEFDLNELFELEKKG